MRRGILSLIGMFSWDLMHYWGDSTLGLVLLRLEHDSVDHSLHVHQRQPKQSQNYGPTTPPTTIWWSRYHPSLSSLYRHLKREEGAVSFALSPSKSLSIESFHDILLIHYILVEIIDKTQIERTENYPNKLAQQEESSIALVFSWVCR